MKFVFRNTKDPFRIFKKRKTINYRWTNEFWSKEDIEKLTGIANYTEIGE